MPARIGIFVVVTLLTLANACFSGAPKQAAMEVQPGPSPAPEAFAGFKGLLRPEVWRQITAQHWYAGAATDAPHARLIEVIATYFEYATGESATKALGAFPAGISEDMLSVIDKTAVNWKTRDLLAAAWFQDGVSPIERDLSTEASELNVGLATFGRLLDRAAKTHWVLDGIDAAERDVLRTVIAMAQDSFHGQAESLISLLQDARVRSESVLLPESGPKRLVVLSWPSEPQRVADDALATFKTILPQVERIAGPYKPESLVLQVWTPGLQTGPCGHAYPQGGSGRYVDSVPGLVRLEPRCMDATALAHEAGHVFIGGGPALVYGRYRRPHRCANHRQRRLLPATGNRQDTA
jgi:hypothetical protein